jgi:hypothetical protein
MKTKLLKHKWIGYSGYDTKLLRRMSCTKCYCEKGYSPAFGCVIYVDRFGKMSYRSPECVMPNTKMK